MSRLVCSVFPHLIRQFACRVSRFVSILDLGSCHGRGSCLACFLVSSGNSCVECRAPYPFKFQSHVAARVLRVSSSHLVIRVSSVALCIHFSFSFMSRLVSRVFPRLIWWFVCRVSRFVSILVLVSCRGSCPACFLVSSGDRLSSVALCIHFSFSFMSRLVSRVFPRLIWWFACRVSRFVSILVLVSCRGSCPACFLVTSGDSCVECRSLYPF